MSSSLVQVRMDTELRDNANQLFDELGLDMSTAIKMFLKKCVAEGGIPFSLKVPKNKEYKSSDGMAALRELQREAELNGLSDMSLDEINAEISAARAEPKDKTQKGA
ncbi:MAG: type II toxin-antitoxin system RelB/DinJ family antitoxin [Chordicoccus sp.]